MENPPLPALKATERPLPALAARPLPDLRVRAVRAATMGGLVWAALWLVRWLLGRSDRAARRVRLRQVTVVTWVEVWRD